MSQGPQGTQGFQGIGSPSTGNALYVELAHTEHQGVPGGQCSTGSWIVLPITDKLVDANNICILAGNYFTLPAGTYNILAHQSGQTPLWLRLYNTCGLNAMLYGPESIGYGTHLSGQFILTCTSTLAIQYYCTTTSGYFDLGNPLDVHGLRERYLTVNIWEAANLGPQGLQGTNPGVQGPQGLQGLMGFQGRQGLQGVQGVRGLQGNSGNIGYQGVQGRQGLQGVQGIVGWGVQGIQGGYGFTGPQGFQGTNPGVQGPQGDNPGSQGVQGFQGLTGVQGGQGTQGCYGLGPQGTQGYQGGYGFQGLQGVQSDRGLQGFQGFQGFQGTGVQGLQGTQGIQGWQGSQGKTGTGFQGIQGVQGTQGWQGVTGIQGSGFQGNQGEGGQGPQGSQGNPGAGFQGIQGIQGLQGFQGFQGFQGSGFQGVQGLQGLQGVQGTQGVQGAQGTQGSQGAQGFQGFQGRQGLQGFQGLQGTQGSQGSQGTQGFQGYQGVQGVMGETSGLRLWFDSPVSDLTLPTITRTDIAFVLGPPGTITRVVGSFVADGFTAQQKIKVVGSLANSGNWVVTNVAPTVMTLTADAVLTPEGASPTITISVVRETLTRILPPGVEQDESRAIVLADGDVCTSSFATELTVPGALVIPAGTWLFHAWAWVSSTLGTTTTLKFEVLKVTAAGLESYLFETPTSTTIIATSNMSAQEVVQLYTFGTDIPLLTTDRIIVRPLFVTDSTPASRTVHFIYQGSSRASYVDTTLYVSAPVGFQGAQGWQGFQGFQGMQGVAGGAGIQGVQGAQGSQGTQGFQGFQGFQGLQGFQGFQGWQGTGLQGIQGFQGFQGGAAVATNLYRYNVNATAGEEVEVLASNNTITYSRAGNLGTFVIPAGVRIISAMMRIPGAVLAGGQFIVDMGTNDMGNGGLPTRWQPLLNCIREDTGAIVAVTVTFNATLSQYNLNNLNAAATNHIRLAF